ncbi:MAG: class I SAM-dependent methyltransferase [Gammaproteobacteria bacterium]|nr:class I SAM-dependent methyltransferase [Gammaproteobacteria bacterium]
MSSELTRLNGFKKGDNGVFSAAGETAKFDYSDGQESEQRLHAILSNAEDLSSESQQLRSQITDWPSEYHLTSLRANLLRPLDLTGVERVLELGCGCGAITRYLSDNTEAQIDAVEGSPVRAELAALRCRDADNVTISTGNFNELTLPKNHYDLILFVGVTEYAGRFSDRDSDQAALQDLLALARGAGRADVIVLIAIENRLGLKYALGASEDHYGIPMIGIQNYPESTGIRTYSKTEWISQIEQAGFEHNVFCYPFPDYKLPTLMVSERAAQQRFAAATESVKTGGLMEELAEVSSRDYLRPFNSGTNEGVIWQTLLQSGALAQLANSFMILLSGDSARLQRMSDFDWRSFPKDPPAYLRENASQPVPAKPVPIESDLASVDHAVDLRAEIQALQAQLAQERAERTLLAGSRGWRFLNRIRGWLGRARID